MNLTPGSLMLQKAVIIARVLCCYSFLELFGQRIRTFILTVLIFDVNHTAPINVFKLLNV